MTLSPTVLLFVVTLAATYYLGSAFVEGVKKLGHEAKRGGAAVGHVLKKIPHPAHHEDPAP